MRLPGSDIIYGVISPLLISALIYSFSWPVWNRCKSHSAGPALAFTLSFLLAVVGLKGWPSFPPKSAEAFLAPVSILLFLVYYVLSIFKDISKRLSVSYLCLIIVSSLLIAFVCVWPLPAPTTGFSEEQLLFDKLRMIVNYAFFCCLVFFATDVIGSALSGVISLLFFAALCGAFSVILLISSSIYLSLLFVALAVSCAFPILFALFRPEIRPGSFGSFMLAAELSLVGLLARLYSDTTSLQLISVFGSLLGVALLVLFINRYVFRLNPADGLRASRKQVLMQLLIVLFGLVPLAVVVLKDAPEQLEQLMR